MSMLVVCTAGCEVCGGTCKWTRQGPREGRPGALEATRKKNERNENKVGASKTLAPPLVSVLGAASVLVVGVGVEQLASADREEGTRDGLAERMPGMPSKVTRGLTTLVRSQRQTYVCSALYETPQGAGGLPYGVGLAGEGGATSWSV